jgi:hypothetical protein
MSWQDQYTRAENRLGVPNGRATVRPFPGGQKIGRSPVINNQPFSGQSNTKIVSVASYNQALSGSGTATVDIRTPSSRLKCAIQVFVERDGLISEAPVLVGAIPCVATLRALGVNPLTGNHAEMQPLATFNPPYVYQVDPGFREVRLGITLDYRNWQYSATFVRGTLKVSASWEPNVEMGYEELNSLQALCSITVPDVVQL